jgi:hypothetical protein
MKAIGVLEMKRIYLLGVAVVASLVVSAFAAGHGSAAVVHPKLNAVASDIAGRQIVATCEQDRDQYDWDFTYDNWGVLGVWYGSMPNDVFLAPAACEPLLTQQNYGLKDAGLRFFAVGVLTLVHESFHARSNGVWSEADTEACAMKYLSRGIEDFGIYSTHTVAVKKTVTRWVKRKIRGRVVRYRTSRVVTVYRDVTNPDYGRILDWGLINHNELPPQYLNGVCPI